MNFIDDLNLTRKNERHLIVKYRAQYIFTKLDIGV